MNMMYDNMNSVRNHRFCYQANQFWGECLPCTASDVRSIAQSALVNRKIDTRQMVEKAIGGGLSLDALTSDADFRKFCQKQEE